MRQEYSFSAFAAERFGCESALFVSSGTQGNLLALVTHCRRGDEYLASDQAHCYRSEGGGGGMRQAGLLAAAGLYALENNLPRLAHDHALARILAEGLAPLPGLQIDRATVQSNMVFVTMANGREEALKGYLREQGILVGGYGTLRFVTHLDLRAEDIICVVEACQRFVER